MRDKLLKSNSAVLNKRLTQLMKEKNFTITKLSEQTGVAVGSIQKMQVDPTSNPTMYSLCAISRVLKTTVSYLIGQSPDATGKQKTVDVFKWLPSDFIHQEFTLDVFLQELGQPCKTAPISIALSSKAFALLVEDDEMFPLFPMHSILVFEPKWQPQHVSYILVKLTNNKSPVVKQLLIEKKQNLLLSVSPLAKKKDTLLLNPSDKVMATLAQVQFSH